MKFNETKMKQAKEEALKILQESEDKSTAIVDVMDKLISVQYEDLISEIKEQANKAESDASYAKTLGLRNLSKEEKDFYTSLKDVKQAITAKQIDIIPTSIVDITLEDVKKESKLLEDVNFAPANVKKWLVAEKSGTFSWEGYTDAIAGELSAEIEGLNFEISKLTVYLVIPKAISDLALPFVDKYFTAILKEAINDGLEYGYLQGNGLKQPVGIYKQIGEANSDKTQKDKTVNTTLKNFTPKGMAAAKVYLSKNGKRTLDKLVLICHPNDEANYVAPAIYDSEGRMISSYKNMEVKTSANNPQGKAALVIPKKFTMGISKLGINEYKETKALDDADLVIGKCYADGRAVDDNIAFVFDVTKLEEYVSPVKVVGTVETTVKGTVSTEETTPGA